MNLHFAKQLQFDCIKVKLSIRYALDETPLKLTYMLGSLSSFVSSTMANGHSSSFDLSTMGSMGLDS